MKQSTPHSTHPILIIGGGQMGFALAKGLESHSPLLIEPYEDRRAHLSEHNLTAIESLHHTPDDFIPRIIVLAIKPQTFADAMPVLRDYITKIHAKSHSLPLLISILAGIPTEKIQAALMPHIPVIRAMPNTPALIRYGISACYASASVSEKDRTLATQILSSLGDIVWLEQETDMNIATALSGSGPAYVFYFIESLIAAGIAQGLSPEVSETLARATLKGSVALSEHMDIALAQLRKNVTSPGGTTEAGLTILMDETSGLAPLIAQTIARAKQRAEALAEQE